MFAASADRWPDRVALDIPPGRSRPSRRTLTYADLRAKAARLSGRLAGTVRPDAVVAVMASRHREHLVIAQLATLAAGGAYVCLEAAFPDEQIRQILADAEPVAMLADADGCARLRAIDPRLSPIDLDDDDAPAGPSVATGPDAAPPLSPANLAYLIYTSGTTGRPKGVMIEHRSIVNLVRSDIEEFGLTPDDRVGQTSSPAYDSFLEEVWLAWGAGAAVVVMDDDTSRLGPDLVPWLVRERITVLCPPPTLLRATACVRPDVELPDLRILYVGGEALTTDVADRWAVGRRMVNGYGPTEVTVTSVRADVRAGEPVRIGRPVPGLDAWIVSEALEEVAPGDRGELCLGGIGLARGYRHLPELTAERFPMHARFGRIYRTGDLVSRDARGDIFYYGRIDAQIKLRGYRIELEAIETHLAACEGVREAACTVQRQGLDEQLVAFVVPRDADRPPVFADLADALARVLPSYMVPARFGWLDALPRTVGGKLHRHALPVIDRPAPIATPASPPRTPIEGHIVAVLASLTGASRVPADADFFLDLGGDSLRAALLISSLRASPATAGLTVRDVYEARTAAGLALRAQSGAEDSELRGTRADAGAGPADGPGSGSAPDSDSGSEPGSKSAGDANRRGQPGARPLLATLIQTAWIGVSLALGGSIAAALAVTAFPAALQRLGPAGLIVVAPLAMALAGAVYFPVALALVVGLKRALIGVYRPTREPVWGAFHIRHWIVREAARTLLPWSLAQGTVLQAAILRALGARIGARVHIHRGVSLLEGGWDLLDIGDDVTLSQDASVRLVDLDDGHLVIGPIAIGAGCTLGVRAGLSPGSRMEANASLTPLSSLESGARVPEGECWDGVPARPTGRSSEAAPRSGGGPDIAPFWHGTLLSIARAALGWLLVAPAQIMAWGFLVTTARDGASVFDWLRHPFQQSADVAVALAASSLALAISVAWAAAVCRLMGAVRPGVISRWSAGYVRVWLKVSLVEVAGDWLSGTLFWPLWLRAAGMRIGRGCEISTIIDVVPELISIGDTTFLADGIYLGGPAVHRGTVTLAPARLGQNVFLGNHVIVPGHRRVSDDVLLGVCTVADADTIPAHTAWFGHPAFALPRREVVDADRRLTHDPSPLRYGNRVFWEALRFALPIVPLLAGLAWFDLVTAAHARVSWPMFLFVVGPGSAAAMAAFFCVLILAMKWVLLGRVRPGQHPLWSCWCSRWDFLYVAWGLYARRMLTALEGTLWLTMFLRAAGATIGRRVVLGEGFSQVVDPDMLTFEDDSTVDCQFQAHTFEDRVLKIDRVRIRRGATVGTGAVLLYGADIGEGAHVAPHSVVMKRERLLPGQWYAGVPTGPIAAPTSHTTRETSPSGSPPSVRRSP